MPKHSRIIAITSAMPYEGRNWVRASYHEGRQAALAGDAKTCLEKAGAIDHLASRHRLQTVGAFAMAAANTVIALSGHDSNWISAAYDTVYGLANAGVVWTQRTLARQLTEKIPEDQRDIELDVAAHTLESSPSIGGSPSERSPEKEPDPGQKLFTNGAHAGFLATAAHGLISAF